MEVVVVMVVMVYCSRSTAGKLGGGSGRGHGD